MGVYEYLMRKKSEWEDKLWIEQKKAFFRWLETKDLLSGDSILLALSDGAELFQYSGFDWQKTSLSQIQNFRNDIRFIFCSKNTLEEIFSLLSLSSNKKDWKSIFSSEKIQIWENKDYYLRQKKELPLRLGLNEEEKKWITKDVRRMIGDVLKGGEPEISSVYPTRFTQKQDVDVALWVKGKLRASVIMTEMTCREALEVGAKRATADLRFKPVALEELPFAQIEITFMSDLIVPLTTEEYTKNEIDPTKGYMVSFQGKKGWYLPAVHNVVRFLHLQNLLSRLSKEKAGIKESVFEVSVFGQFEVFDWIESESTIFTLSGPVPERKKEPITRDRIQHVAKKAIEWLGHLQQDNGNIPAIVSGKGTVEKNRFVALGCTAHALASYGKKINDEKALSISKKAYVFLRQQNGEVNFLDNVNNATEDFFSAIYFLRLSLLLEEEVEKKHIQKIVTSLPLFVGNPILWLQSLSLLLDYARQNGGNEYLESIKNEAIKALKRFERERDLPDTQTAFYPELIAVFFGLWGLTREEVWRERALGIGQWYQKIQKEDGSFPTRLKQNFSYTRGTGKIFEALACLPGEHTDSLESIFRWLEGMQYSDEAVFWAGAEGRGWLVGGFRHDAFNREAWVDGTAHVLLGAARWVGEKK